MHGRHAYIAAILLAGLAACSQQPALSPAPGAMPAPNLDNGAMAEAAGVRMSASASAWRGNPTTLGNEVTPILVRIDNNGAEPLVIRYQNFEFMNPAGRNFEAVPVYNINATAVQPVTVPAFTLRSFSVAPHLRRYYRLRAWNDPFFYDPVWFGQRYTVWQRVELPTADMVRMALPEGVLDPGGVAEGFVYFERVRGDDKQVELAMNLVTPSGSNIGRIEIPFIVD